jgi:histidinol phosphatase-like enzyme
MARLFLIDRDGVVLVTQGKHQDAADLAFISGAPEAIAKLTAAGFKVAVGPN